MPSLLAITTGSLPSNTATHEFVVPKKIFIGVYLLVIIFVLFILRADALRFSLNKRRAKRERASEYRHIPGFCLTTGLTF